MIGVRLSRVLFGILLLVVGACQATEPPSHETIASQDQWRPGKPVPRVEMSPQDVAAARQDYLTMYAQSLQLTSVPSVPAEQIGYPEVVVPLQQQCLTAAGVAAQVEPDGSLQTDQGAAQRSPAIATALFTCTARFFPDPRWNLQPTQPQLELVWDYTHRFLIPCLRSHQVRVPDPPTEQRWVKSGGRGWEYPDLSGNPDREQIIRHCLPTVPSAWYLGDRQE